MDDPSNNISNSTTKKGGGLLLFNSKLKSQQQQLTKESYTMSLLQQTQQHNMMSLDAFQEQLDKGTTTLEEKFQLLKSQFAYDPFTFDHSHTSVNISSHSTMQNQLIGNISMTHIEMIVLFLKDLIAKYLNPHHETLDISTCNPNTSDILLFIPHLQSLLSISIAKLYTSLIFTELFDQKIYFPPHVHLVKEAALTISAMIFYMLTQHQTRLKPNFRPFIVSRISECLSSLAQHSERELYVKAKQSQVYAQQPMSAQVKIGRKGGFEKKKSSEYSQNFDLVMAPGSEFPAEQSQPQLTRRSLMNTEDGLTELDKDTLEAVFYSIIKIINGLSQDYQTQSKLQDSLISQILTPLFTCSSNYETVFFDSLKDWSQASATANHSTIKSFETTLLDTQYQFQQQKPQVQTTLFMLLMRTLVKVTITNQSYGTVQSSLSNPYQTKGAKSSQHQMLNQSSQQSNAVSFFSSRNDQVAKVLDSLIKKHIVYYLLHFEWQKEETKREEENKIMIPDIRLLASPQLKRQKTLSSLFRQKRPTGLTLHSARDLSGGQNQSGGIDHVSGGNRDFFQIPSKQDDDEAQSPTKFIMKMIGASNPSVASPKNINNNLNNETTNGESPTHMQKIKRVSDGNEKKPKVKKDDSEDQEESKQRPSDQVHNLDSSKAEQDSKVYGPQSVLSEEQVFNKLMKNSNLRYSQKGLCTNPEAQLNWIRVSHSLLEVAIELLKSSFGLIQDQSTIKNQYLFISMFDLFKITLWFICQYRHYSEFFSDKVQSLSEIADSSNYPCLLTQTFQIIMNITNSDNKAFLETFYDEFQDIIVLFSKGIYDQVDRNYILRIYYHVFFDKIITKGTPQKLYSIALNLLNFFNSYFYPEQRIKDIESMDYLKYRKNYRLLLSKFKQQEEARLIQSQDAKQPRFNALHETNKILFQQQILEIITIVAHFIKSINELCWKEIDKVLANEYSIEVNQSKLYQYLKLSISLMKNQQIQNNREFYQIICSDEENDQKLYLEYQPWSLIAFCKENFIKDFWDIIINKIKTYLQTQSDLFQSKNSQYHGKDSGRNHHLNKDTSAASKDELNQLIMRNQSERRDPHGKGAGAQASLISDTAYNQYKRFLIFGIQNTDICNRLQKQLMSIIFEIKDYELSYDIKLVILKILLINKDKSPQQEEILRNFYQCIKSLIDYVNQVDIKLNQMKSSTRKYLFENQINLQKEQEKQVKVKHIKLLVSVCVSLLQNYIDFKEKFLYDSNQKLDLLQYDHFDVVLKYIKALVLKIKSPSFKLGEQLLRIFFFNKIELLNLCHFDNNANKGVLNLDSRMNHNNLFSQKYLDLLLTYLVECTENVQEYAHLIIKNFVNVFHARIVQQQTVHAIKFAKSLSISAIKNLKKILIFIREKEDQLLDVNQQIKDIIVKTFAALPNPLIVREFFSFFREIFYYNKDMDKVDFNLAVDTLQILNSLLKNTSQQLHGQSSSSSLLKIPFQNISSNQEIDIHNISDYFYFSDQTPGLIISDNFKIPQEDFTICMLFKLNLHQLRQYCDKTGQDSVTMTMLQLIDKKNSENYPPWQFVIHVMKDRIKILNYDSKVDEQWHLLILKFNIKKKIMVRDTYRIRIFIDGVQKAINSETKIHHKFHKNHEHVIAYGCNLIDYQNEVIKTRDYIQGKMSLPFVFQKFDFEKSCIDAESKQIFLNFILDCISKKQIINLAPQDVQNFFKSRMKVNKDFPKDFECNDLNEQVIIRHMLANDAGHIGVVHCTKAHHTLVGLGGFKLLYPIFEKSLSSNLGVYQKSEIWKQIFKILRTMMNVEPQHINRLFRNKHLIEILKYCLIRGGLSNLITKDLLQEIINIVKDACTNKQADILESFYKRYLHEIILSDNLCDLVYDDVKKKRRGQVFIEIAESLYQIYMDEENLRDKLKRSLKSNNSRKLSGSDSHRSFLDINEFFNDQTSVQCFKQILHLIKKFNQPEYLKQTKLLGLILMKIILRFQQKEGFAKIIQAIQRGHSKSNPQEIYEKTTMLTLLKITHGVIKDQTFSPQTGIYQMLKQTLNIDKLLALLNQSNSLLENIERDGKLEDEVIAVTFRILMTSFVKFYDSSQKQKVQEKQNLATNQSAIKTQFIEDKERFIKSLFEMISRNPKGIQLQKTLCSIILTAIEQKYKIVLKHSGDQVVKYNPSFLKEYVKEGKVLEIMGSEGFDNDLLEVTIQLFQWYDFETKLCFLEFYRQLIESKEHNIEDFDSFKMKNFRRFLRDIYAQHDNILNIVQLSLQTKDHNIVGFSERIITSIIKCFIDTSLDIEVEAQLSDDEINYIKLIKKLLFILDSHSQSQLMVINEVLKYTQEVVNWVWSYRLQDSNRTNLNLKLLILLQTIEEIVIRNGKVPVIFKDELFYQVLARFLIIFDDTKLIYFDFPNPPIIEERRTTIHVQNIANKFQYKETFTSRDFNFNQGGPLRIFLSILLQMLRKHKEGNSIIDFECLGQMIRYLLFKDESPFVQQFRPVPVIDSQPQQQALLFKMIYNVSAKKTGYVLNPLDLTRQFIEKFVEHKEFKDSIVQTPGFLPLILMTEVQEIIRRKLVLYYYEEKRGSPPKLLQQMRLRLMWHFQLFFDIMKNAYFSEQFRENIGYMLITITDPRLKEDLYQNLRHVKAMQDINYSKLYYMSKPYHPQSEGTFSEVEGMTPSGHESPIKVGGMKESYFNRKSDFETNSPGQEQPLPAQKQELEDDEKAEEQLFTEAALETNKLEEAQIIKQEETRDSNYFQDEIIKFFTMLFSKLKEKFDTTLNSSSSSHFANSVENIPIDDLDFIQQISQQYFDNERAQQIFLAIRTISSEKFKPSLELVYITCTKQEMDIKNQLREIQIEGESHYQKYRIQINRQQQNQYLMNAMTQSQPNFNSKGSSSNLIAVQNQMAQRKESTDTINTFEQLSDTPGTIKKDNKAINNIQQNQGSSKHRTLFYYYTKHQYCKTVKRLMEDPSSLWYDNLEQIKKDYSDLKEVYELICGPSKPPPHHQPSLQQQPGLDMFLLDQSKDQGAGGGNPLEESKLGGGSSSKNNFLMQSQKMPTTSSQFTKLKQYDHFVRQRRNTDSWGRMMLLKPDRKYKETKFWMTHLYFVHDFLKNLLAVSLLDDSDFPDYQQMLATLQQQQFEQQQPQQNSMNINLESNEMLGTFSMENLQRLPQSEQFRRLRELLMNKLEQNDFLYSLLSNPGELVNGPKPFDFHQIDPKNDSTLEWKCDAQYIAVEGPYYGEFYLSNQYLMFKSKCEPAKEEYRFALHIDEQFKKNNKVFHINGIEQIFKRRFLLINQACEIFTREKKSYFFNFLTEESCQQFFTKISEINKRNKYNKIDLITNARAEFNNRRYKQDWCKGLISNQQFLLLVNKFSGRSFNDLTQYPIFPWVISDYNCDYEELKAKIERGEGLRDLTLHTGIISESKRQYAHNQYNKDEDAKMIYGNDRFHLKFGYSNKMFSLAYLIRLDPFTDSFIQVNKSLDNPDRIMYSINDQWRSIETDPQNNSELSPEFFYFPEVLRNHNLHYFGKNRDGYSVNEVMLPKWAKNEHDFIRINREVLDSKQVTKGLKFWLDMIFGVRQKDESCMNIFFCYAYESYLAKKENREQMEPANIDTIKEFMQVPHQLFTEKLWNEKIVNKNNNMLMPVRETRENLAFEDFEQFGGGIVAGGEMTPTNAKVDQKSKALQHQSIAQKGGLLAKLTQKATNTKSYAINDKEKQKEQQFRGSSLIQKFIDIQGKKQADKELKKIHESHKLDKNDDKNIFHLAFSLNGRCLVFTHEKESGLIKCVACRESFLQEELKNLCNIGLRIQNLRGDFSNVFQLYSDKNTQKQQLLFTCQNLDNTIKVYDLNIKRGTQLVYQEHLNQNVVTAIKFSPDFKYFLSGDYDGVIHHYQRASEDIYEYYSSAMASSSPLPKIEQDINKCFPFLLKFKIQDQMGAILGIDVNLTLDMYVTVSADGTIALRCLRTSQLWKVINNEKLTIPGIQVQSLKLSLHGYIFLIMKNHQKVFTQVFSINGDQLLSHQRDNDLYEFKYAQFTQQEDQLIMVFNQKLKKEEPEMSGIIRVVRLYDLEKDKRKELQSIFYPAVSQMINPVHNQRSRGGASTAVTFDQRQQNTKMPAIRSFALSQDESKMNLILSSGEIICFDESKEEIIKQLDDFGLA